ncbi:hypothetical protein Rumeso_04953 [Rubellimicrobium mesophilum DSM 19309]|uniref:Uncharacterized protein n=1 Tax=Rubellimicrobium mesophilum DSM 19309 TaxID=442562 RepID=A0A017HAR5_9RHOB|nr:hypothetical protein [Rubellimicrobium mesophilum]EYD71552.1 hypothetical protein Rumeso_04953 [Rubellimicrobium mesophilum DSM 19309]
MSEEPKPEGRSMEELLDNTPEAVAMRRTRALRAEARAKVEAARAREEAKPPKPGSLKRRAIVGGVLAIAAAARLMAKFGRSSRTP